MKNKIIEIGHNYSGIIVNSRVFGEKIVLIDNEDINRIKCLSSVWVNDYRGIGKFYSFSSMFGYGCDNSKISLHRYIMSFPIGSQIDHINNNGLDNRKENLRIVDNLTNNLNKSFTPRKINKHKGVYWIKDKGKYRVNITINSKTIYLGYYKCPIEASMVFDNFIKNYYGEKYLVKNLNNLIP
jgi:hypothetical protein